MRLVLLGVLLSTVGACGTSPEECRAYANELGAMLSVAAEDRPFPVYVPDSMTLVERDGLPRHVDPYAKAIEILPTETRFGGKRVEREELAKQLAEELVARTKQRDKPDPRDPASARSSGPIEPRLVYLVIDARTPWTFVVDAFDAATFAGMTAMAIAFHVPQPLHLPPRAPIDDKLDEILLAPSGGRAHEMSKLIEQQIRSCPGIGVAITAVVARDSGDKSTQLAKVVPDALTHCACRVNMADLRSSLFRLIYIPHPIRALHFDPAQPADTIALPATATWAEAARQIAPTTRNAVFAVTR